MAIEHEVQIGRRQATVLGAGEVTRLEGERQAMLETMKSHDDRRRVLIDRAMASKKLAQQLRWEGVPLQAEIKSNLKVIEPAAVKAAERLAERELGMQKIKELKEEAEQAMFKSRWVQLVVALRLHQAMHAFEQGGAEDLEKAKKALEEDAEAHKDNVFQQQQYILKLQAEVERREVELKNWRRRCGNTSLQTKVNGGARDRLLAKQEEAGRQAVSHMEQELKKTSRKYNTLLAERAYWMGWEGKQQNVGLCRKGTDLLEALQALKAEIRIAQRQTKAEDTRCQSKEERLLLQIKETEEKISKKNKHGQTFRTKYDVKREALSSQLDELQAEEGSRNAAVSCNALETAHTQCLGEYVGRQGPVECSGEEFDNYQKNFVHNSGAVWGNHLGFNPMDTFQRTWGSADSSAGFNMKTSKGFNKSLKSSIGFQNFSRSAAAVDRTKSSWGFQRRKKRKALQGELEYIDDWVKGVSATKVPTGFMYMRETGRVNATFANLETVNPDAFLREFRNKGGVPVAKPKAKSKARKKKSSVKGKASDGFLSSSDKGRASDSDEFLS